MDRQVINLNAVVVKLEPLLRQLLGEEIGLEVELDAGLGDVEAAPDRLELLIMKLAARAKDRAEPGGHLILATRNDRLETSRELRQGVVPRGRYVVVSAVTVPEAPESETKTPSRPVDVGPSAGELSETVRAMGGHILSGVHVPGQLMVEVYLPRLEGELLEERARENPDEIRFAETILLADDEEPVREFARMVLEKKGYRVLVAKNGAEAIRVSKTHAGPIHLMLADVVMPELGGPEAVRQLNRIRPEMRVLFLSGYSNRVVSRDKNQAFGRAYLQKPFTVDSLSDKVREVLDAKPDPPTV